MPYKYMGLLNGQGLRGDQLDTVPNTTIIIVYVAGETQQNVIAGQVVRGPVLLLNGGRASENDIAN